MALAGLCYQVPKIQNWKKKKHNKRQTDSSGTFVLEAFIQKTLMIYISYHICILYMCHVWFLSFLGTTDVNNYLHICIVLFEVSRAIFSTYFLYYVVMMLWYVLTLFEIKKKKHLSIQAWVRVMLVSVVNIIHWYYLFLTCDISLGYIEKTKIDEKKKFEKNLNQTNAPVIRCLLWSLADVVTRLSARVDALHLALRVEGIFLLQNVSTQREEKKKRRAMRAPLHFIRM